ncbi:MAG: S-layer protein, partial [Planctomycetia bacterium 21-64-5]
MAVTAVVLLVAFGPMSPPARAAKTPGLGDPGRLDRVEFAKIGQPLLDGPDARKQLLVDGKYSSGQVRDLTPAIIWQASPAGIVAISPAGLVTPLADGTVKITAKTEGGMRAATELTVKNFTTPRPINFPNQIVPIFTKNGCNAGGCHGKSTGQNGFRLSLLGFYPSDDYEFLVKEARGRRLFPSAPDQSLLLLKATNTVAHGGGHRLEKESYEYGQIVRWLEQGMPYGKPDDPVVERIEVFPATRAMDRDSRQQLAVLAYYTDGSTEDVTHIAQYESNDGEMAEVSPAGLVHTFDLTGDVAVMARFQSQVSVFRATLPLGIEVADGSLPPRRNFIDELVFAKLKALGIPPSPVCDDATFVRRATLDIAGRLPTADEALAFVADADQQKRDKLIDRLLDSAGYADYFANKWSVILRNQRVNQNYTRGTYAFHDWIRRGILTNKSYDQFVRDIVGASGEMGQNPPVAWYRAVQTSEQQLEDTAQLFLGLRIQCARCHHHPFERWSQHDYYSFSAFFSRVGRKNGINGLQPRDEQRIFHNRGEAVARNPRTGENLKPAGLGSGPLEIGPDHDPRQ